MKIYNNETQIIKYNIYNHRFNIKNKIIKMLSQKYRVSWFEKKVIFIIET